MWIKRAASADTYGDMAVFEKQLVMFVLMSWLESLFTLHALSLHMQQ